MSPRADGVLRPRGRSAIALREGQERVGPVRQASRKKKVTREERAQQIFHALMQAAEAVVSERGYAATSIAKVAETAGVSPGTFYNYFDDRQNLFDRLLPSVGKRMIREIRAEVPRDLRGAAREMARFRAYCHFLERNPGFYRILYEAEIFAPAAHAEHMALVSDGFRRSFRRSIDLGEMPDIPEEELDGIVFALLGARAYVAMRYNQGTAIPEPAIEGYARLIRPGLFTA
jgi:AcrR family transcriptional regulator